MAMVLVIVAGILITFSFLLSQGDTNNALAGNMGIIGIVVFIVGALLHMRNRRNEQLEALRGRGNDSKGDGNGRN